MGVHGLLVLLVGVGLAWGRVPIPSEPLGYVYKGVPPTAPIHIEFFIDLLCPDSKAAFPVLKQIGDHYGSTVRIAAINFPLPYHRNAFLAAKGVHVVQNMTNGDLTKIYSWMAAIFENIKDFGGSENFNVPENKTVSDFAAVAGGLGLSSSAFADTLVNDRDIEMDLRAEWKYACTRGIAGTPWFTVNGVLVAADEFWTVEDWKNLIDPLVEEHNERSRRGRN